MIASRIQSQTFPLLAPQPPRLSRHTAELMAIEASGVYSNYGPMNTTFEAELIELVFREGACVTVCNATLGLIIAIQEAISVHRRPECRYALMPSFTFAATAQAALWCGLTPLLCDIDPHTWLPDTGRELELLEQFAGQIAVIVPYATFGNNLDLQRYRRLAEDHGIPIVVDAAASLGSYGARDQAFGAGFPWSVVFSMHATKAFSVGEGGVIYCADKDRVERLRAMASFGFSGPHRSASMLGLNAKLSEVAALTARLQLHGYARPMMHRELLLARYRAELGNDYGLQQQVGWRQTQAFQSLLLPAVLGPQRETIIAHLRSLGIGAGCYFSPHLAEQPYFQTHAISGPLPVTSDIASRILSLPLLPDMHPKHVSEIVAALRDVTARLVSTQMSYSTDSNPFLGQTGFEIGQGGPVWA